MNCGSVAVYNQICEACQSREYTRQGVFADHLGLVVFFSRGSYA